MGDLFNWFIDIPMGVFSLFSIFVLVYINFSCKYLCKRGDEYFIKTIMGRYQRILLVKKMGHQTLVETI